MTLHDRLKNWGRAYRVGKHKPKHCYSVEWRTQGWHQAPEAAQIEWLYQNGFVDNAQRKDLLDSRPKERPDPIDQLDAMLVEMAWRTMDNERQKYALRQNYVKSWTYFMIARKLREGDIDNFMLLSEGKLAIQIDFVSAMKQCGLYPRVQITDSASLISDLRLAA